MVKTLKPLFVAAIALFPLAAVAAPLPPAPTPVPSHIIRVDGWWEDEHREHEFAERYWDLPPEQRQRYDWLEYQIQRAQQRQRHEAREGDRREYDELAEQIEAMRREQYRMLHFWD